MANVTVRNLDDAVVEALKERARANNRSLEGELRQILADAVRPAGQVDLRALAERVAAMTPDRPQTDSVDLLHEDRRR
jgi:plasmid stability protein